MSRSTEHEDAPVESAVPVSLRERITTIVEDADIAAMPKSCLIFEQKFLGTLQQLSPIHKSLGFKAKFKFKSVTQNRTTDSDGRRESNEY